MKENVVKMDDVKDEVVNEALSSMDNKLEGEDLLYKLIVNDNENGEINIPKDQFLKTASYDKDAKKLVFIMETTHGETTTEVNISDLVAFDFVDSVIPIVIDGKLIPTHTFYSNLGLDINGQCYDSIKNGGKPIKTPKLFR